VHCRPDVLCASEQSNVLVLFLPSPKLYVTQRRAAMDCVEHAPKVGYHVQCVHVATQMRVLENLGMVVQGLRRMLILGFPSDAKTLKVLPQAQEVRCWPATGCT
jgi:hypothetical protein